MPEGEQRSYLRPEFSIDGLRVIVSFSARHDLATACADSPAIVTVISINRAPTDEEKAVAAAAARDEATQGLMLSKIGGHWAIDAVQRWWLRYARYLDRMPRNYGKELWAWNLEGQQLMTTFPQCESSGPTKKEGAH
jgi:hypothetical protein